jgi:2-dehydro-3-deoxyphosphooctonate aldolase (KDO 8-P synthase)
LSDATSNPVQIGPVVVGGGAPLAVIAGPCVIESRDAALRHAEALARLARTLGLGLIYKSSYDKANRTSGGSFRGVGLDDGLRILADVREATGLPVLTDVHEQVDVRAVSEVADVLQTPALLCRQTDFVLAVAACGKPINLKKGQFLSPWEMGHVVEKARSTGNRNVLVTERGTSFGYQNLVSDMRSLVVLGETGCPVVFDATHSVQLPGGAGAVSGGQREFVPALARAAVAVGIDALFLEVHEDPARALSDGATSWPLEALAALLEQIRSIDDAVRGRARGARGDRPAGRPGPV